MDYEVRRIRSDEWRAYRELRLEALRDSPLAFVDRYEDARRRPDQYWRDRVARNAAGRLTCTYVIARNDGRLAGMTSCFVEPEFTDYVSAHIVAVYVTPGFRGNGSATRLIEAVIAWAHDVAGADRIRLFVMEANERAEAFYRRIGFSRTGATMAYPPDPSFTEYEMEYRRAGAVPLAAEGQSGTPR
ncbi:GNAT family N-acetyltransferase [Phytoactinopolyspora halotolerans]|uniref:GNAT family N-acetyltransferase n=1 Tax=Phytoactinopolyspora halotolerans TaxID=1981512 RepID=A0A6L9S4T7_9ACTN|nr:GNAT family N-acetyltransferase [Phytoactinopolyspora halotolerans]NEE00146.1 GNAT family N-acetyltransferase [Phytoactinopolyspora halotolerans]